MTHGCKRTNATLDTPVKIKSHFRRMPRQWDWNPGQGDNPNRFITVCVCVCKPLDARGFELLPIFLETKPWMCLSFWNRWFLLIVFETVDLLVYDLFRNRGAFHLSEWMPNEEALIRCWYPDWSSGRTCFSPTWHEAKPRTSIRLSLTLFHDDDLYSH